MPAQCSSLLQSLSSTSEATHRQQYEASVSHSQVCFNQTGRAYSQGLTFIPHPLLEDVYNRSNHAITEDDDFTDLGLNNFVSAQHRIVQHQLNRHSTQLNIRERGLLSHPLEDWDQEEGSDEASGVIDTCMSYTVAVGVQGMERDIVMSDEIEELLNQMQDNRDRADRYVQELREEFQAACEAQNALIITLQNCLSFLEDQMDAMHRANIVVQPLAPVAVPEVIDITSDDDIIDLTDDDDGSLSERMLVEIEEIGGPIVPVVYVPASLFRDDPSQEELEEVRRLGGLPIPEEDYSRSTAATDWEADMIVRAGSVALSYENPPPYLPLYQPIEYHLQW